jgi:hypothetical protein
MAAPVEKTQGMEEVEQEPSPGKVNIIQTDHSSDSDVSPQEQPDSSMNKAKWLACIALCLAYTTAYQQNACTAAILKQIDEALGTFLAMDIGRETNDFRTNHILQLDAHSIHHCRFRVVTDIWRS